LDLECSSSSPFCNGSSGGCKAIDTDLLLSLQIPSNDFLTFTVPLLSDLVPAKLKSRSLPFLLPPCMLSASLVLVDGRSIAEPDGEFADWDEGPACDKEGDNHDDAEVGSLVTPVPAPIELSCSNMLRTCTTSSCPLCSARDWGVWPSLSALLGAAPHVSSICTMLMWPFAAAKCSGVAPGTRSVVEGK
jgi:hypothetical protein